MKCFFTQLSVLVLTVSTECDHFRPPKAESSQFKNKGKKTKLEHTALHQLNAPEHNSSLVAIINLFVFPSSVQSLHFGHFNVLIFAHFILALAHDLLFFIFLMNEDLLYSGGPAAGAPTLDGTEIENPKSWLRGEGGDFNAGHLRTETGESRESCPRSISCST